MHTPIDDSMVRFDAPPGGAPRARIHMPAMLSTADHRNAGRWWRELRLDTVAHGLAARRAGPTAVVLEDGDEQWTVPLDRPLDCRLAWNPAARRVAGLTLVDDQVHPWIADYAAKRLQTLPVPVATSLTGCDPRGGGPLRWWDDDTLVILVPAAPPADPADHRPRIHDGTGPGFVHFRPPVEDLVAAAGAAVALVRLGDPRPEILTGAMLVRRLEEDGGLTVEHVTGLRESAGVRTELTWTTTRLTRSGRPGGSGPATATAPVTFPAATRPPGPAPSSTRLLPGRPYPSRLALFDETGDDPSRPVLLWIRARREPVPADRPTLAPLPRHPGTVAALDMPLYWPADATVPMMHEQIAGGIGAALDALGAGGRPVVVGGHSFGATLALYAAAHLPGPVAAIAHSGCYNRTRTPFGFQYERRHYWDAPAMYTAFSALSFADRIRVPVLLVHGLEDVNPATHPDHAVELYQAVVATGGRARLVLLPHEEHNFRYRETHALLGSVHRDWLEVSCAPAT